MPTPDATLSVVEPTSVGEPCGSCRVRSLSVCATLGATELDLLARVSDKIHLSAHEVLCEIGTVANCVYTVLSGVLKVYCLLPDGRRQIVGFPYPGDSLGLFAGAVHVFRVEALTETTLCRTSKKEFVKLVERTPTLARGALDKATRELLHTHNQMILLGRMTAVQRLVAFLRHLAEHTTQPGNTVLRLPMSRADIADYLGLTTETVSRSFSKLRRRGWIQIDAAGNVHVDVLVHRHRVPSDPDATDRVLGGNPANPRP